MPFYKKKVIFTYCLYIKYTIMKPTTTILLISLSATFLSYYLLNQRLKEIEMRTK
jgi:hypothetical protein